MKILLTLHHELSRDAGTGGAVLHLADALRRCGHHVDVMGMPTGRMPAQAQWLAFPWRVARRLWACDADVVEAATGDAWVWGSVRRSRGPALVTRSHGLEHLLHAADLEDWERRGVRPPRLGQAYWGGWRLWEVARSLRVSDMALFLNDLERRWAIAHLGVPAHRTGLVANGIADHFLGRALPAGTDGPVGVAVVGPLDGVKGSRLAAEALIDVLTRHPRVTATFLGCGHDADVLGIFPPGQRRRVTVVPRYVNTDLPGLLDGHEVFLSLPRAEGFGMAVVEAMACGLVPVVSDTAGPRQVVTDGVDGVLVEVGATAEASAAVDALVSGPRRRHRMRAAAHARAQEFGWDRVAQQHLGHYERVLARSGRRGRRRG